MMPTIDDLRRLLVECAGSDATLPPGADIADTPFEDLGYDSLALMETAARIKQEFGIVIEDEALAEAETPRALLDALASAAARV
ncbi:acyl carrier protein [Streptomyces sp. DSM 44917]|uniref:Acyl carrier protein n=1 Tax=Streptomyces boetiae TaxID=3075541 RepID=A0ABU2L4K5_9ACTN|nr:acyl carrier protein [Streptomyces sp. DSM 44917]MDT0306494.1 acyl carrier protein [Streptomyces sp. DSM 44917]